MIFYEVVVQIFSNGQFDHLETHYAYGDTMNEDAAALSVKNNLYRLHDDQGQNSNVAVVIAPGGIKQITQAYYDQQHKIK